MPSLKELHLSDNFFDRCYFDSHANQALSSLPEEENKENAPISESVKTLHLNRCRISRLELHVIADGILNFILREVGHSICSSFEKD